MTHDELAEKLDDLAGRAQNISEASEYGDSPEPHRKAAKTLTAEILAEHDSQAAEITRLTDSVLALRGELVEVRKMWKDTIDQNTRQRAVLEKISKAAHLLHITRALSTVAIVRHDEKVIADIMKITDEALAQQGGK